jgi:hypothetical protein
MMLLKAILESLFHRINNRKRLFHTCNGKLLCRVVGRDRAGAVRACRVLAGRRRTPSTPLGDERVLGDGKTELRVDDSVLDRVTPDKFEGSTRRWV